MKKDLYSAFPPATTSDWKSRLEKDLKGISFDALSSPNRDGINIHPFYHIDQATAGYTVFNSTDWDIIGKIVVKDEATANQQALKELNGGASGLHFVFTGTVNFELLLQDISLPHIFLHLTFLSDEAQLGMDWQHFLKARGIRPDTLNFIITADYLLPLLTGNGRSDSQSSLSLARDTATLSLDASIYQQAGATAAYETGCALAQLNEYLHALQETPCRRVSITVAVDTQFFEQIAKLRSLRKTVTFLLQQYNWTADIRIEAEASNIYRAPVDVYSNLLRDTIAGMAAVLGGCDSLYIPPFDQNKLEPNDFSRRLSRNQQLIFKEESYLNKVADCGAGSYYIETLTRELEDRSWKVFQEIEKAGGFIACCEKGFIQEHIKRQAETLIAAYQAGEKILVGVNKYPDSNDMPHVKPKANFGGQLQPLNLATTITITA